MPHNTQVDSQLINALFILIQFNVHQCSPCQLVSSILMRMTLLFLLFRVYSLVHFALAACHELVTKPSLLLCHTIQTINKLCKLTLVQ